MPSTTRCCAAASVSASPCSTGSTRISSNSSRTCLMELTLLGTGCPQCDPERLGPASLVRHAGRAFLVDCGSGVSQRLVSPRPARAPPDPVFLTPPPSHHILHLFPLVISRSPPGPDRPQRGA